MARRVPDDQLLFEWPDPPTSSCEEDDANDVADYPLRGPSRFEWLPLSLPTDFRFYLGTHHAADLAVCPDPLFLSRRALVLSPAKRGSSAADWPLMDRQRRVLPRALAPWAIDSAGFTELHQFGCHHVPARQYAAEVCRYAREIGNLQFAAVQDWMCEPSVLDITQQTIDTHQRKTVESYMELMEIAPGLPWAPVLQGFYPGDHERHLALYYRQGIALRCAPVDGVGSVCRRQGMVEADQIVRDLSGADLKLHIFGYKFTGLPNTIRFVRSADSMAWSLTARKQNIQMPGHDHSGPSTGEAWQRGPVTAYLQQRDGQWKVRWNARVADSVESVSSRASGREALSAAGFAFVRSLWTCANCLIWARTWRNNMLALAIQAARDDSTVRAYGYRTMNSEELAQWRSLDPAEGHDPRDLTIGDYERSRQRMEALAGVRIPRDPNCPPTSTAPCQPARYLAPRDPPPNWPPPPRVRVDLLPKDPERRPWQTWMPGRSPLDPGPRDALTKARIDELAYGSVEDVWRSDLLAEMYPWPADAVYQRHLAESEDDLPSSPSFARFVALLRVLPRGEQGRARAAFEDAWEVALWEKILAEMPGEDTTRPENPARRPWRHLFGS